MPFDQLSLVWQVWGYMLLGAILMGCGLLVGIEWAFLACCSRATWTAVRGWAVRTFTAAGDGLCHCAAIDARAGALGISASWHCPRCGRRHQLQSVLRPDADEILIGLREHAGAWTIQFPRRPPAPHTDDTVRRRQLLALTETSPFRKTVH